MKEERCVCAATGSTLFSGEGFSRRHFVRVAGTGLLASWFGSVSAAELLYRTASVQPTLRNTARNCIFVFLSGGLSQSDTLDLKEGPWTPRTFEPTSYAGLLWPRGLLPGLAEHVGKLAIIRTGRAWALVHPLAQKWAQISRDPAPATAAFAPHIGAVVALEAQRSRSADDVLPSFISFGETTAGSGYFSGSTAPLAFSAGFRQPVQDLSGQGLAGLSHPDGVDRLESRWKMLQSIDAARNDGALGKEAADMAGFYEDAKRLADTAGVEDLFRFSDEEHAGYGSTTLGDSLILARNLIGANRGTRFVQVTQTGWDHHADIYLPSGLYEQCQSLDRALAALLADLSSTPGVESRKTLLDETLVVILSEFGRTVGPLTSSGGRDHLLRMSAAFAGGGVRGGRAIGATDHSGYVATDFGWSGRRDVRPEDLTATIYSALGIDYTTVRTDDPYGSGFEYVPFAREGYYKPVDELFF
jgi:hypothetical protein